ncbi:SAM-dependent methyltransferase [Nannocystaceae bacterium ST9]
MPERRHAWLTHTPAVARWLKRELAERAPDLRFAFARPGLTTFKIADPDALPDDWRLPSSFARAWGFTLGRASTIDEVLGLAAALEPGPLRLHVFERELDVPIEDQAPRAERASIVRAGLLAAAPERWRPEPRAALGELVLDVIVPHGREPDEPWLVGWHRHSPEHGPDPGGVDYLPPPAESPSRAWSKLEEALRWAELAPRAGELALEIGAAPGGAAFALLERGLAVTGIDPGPIAPQVVRHRSGFTHLRKPFAELERDRLPRRFAWLLLDVNLAPTIGLRYVEDLLRSTGARPRGALLTLKLNDDEVAASLPRLHARLAALAGERGRVRVTQLPSHRSEVVAILDWPRAG